MKILVCEDQQILLDGLKSTLGKDPAFSIAATVRDAKEILPFLRKQAFDLVLTDIITMNKNNALDYVGEIRKEFPAVKIVAITGFPDITFMEKAKKCGVNSFVYKNISTEELISVLKNTFSGYSVFPSEENTQAMFLSSLSDTETAILRLYCSGKEREEISEILYISASSLKSHISSILQKTGFPSMARVAIYAVSNGLIVTE